MNTIRILTDGKPTPFSIRTMQGRDKRWRWQPTWSLRFWHRVYHETFVELEHASPADTPIVAIYEVDFA